MIPDNGNLAETAPIKLLLAIDDQNQTGILSFRKNEILKVFYLNQGKISWAISSDEEDKIEHILLAEKLVTPEALSPYLAGNKISESFGKVLVENGLISLETLINVSRNQLKRIATSIMFWSSGSYQLEAESPPTRLVSLELEIAPLVYNFIQAHMDVNIIWEELGSLSGKLQQASQPEKSFNFTFDAEQQEVFDCFREPQRPETVLLRFAAERKHTILKILYFFLISGMLTRNEAETIPSMDFNELDKLFGYDASASPPAKSTEMPSMINETEIKDIPSLDLPDIPDSPADTKVSAPKYSDLLADRANDKKNKISGIPPLAEPVKTPITLRPIVQEKQKSRWRSISFLSVLIAVVAIAVFLWFNRAPQNLEPEPVRKRPVVKTRQKTPVKQEVIPAEQKTDTLPSIQPVGQTVSAKDNSQNINLKPKAKDFETQKKPQAEKNTIPPIKAPPFSAADARKAFLSGKFSTAGDLWRQELVAGKITFSILLEMDCLEQSVQSAYEQITEKENFFILNRVKDGRSCWLVLWGKFRTQNEAAQNLRLIPEYFLKQSEPPMVIDLEPYL